jgi:succinate dehydrogenase / fumarate reductase cytochrome b subunit
LSSAPPVRDFAFPGAIPREGSVTTLSVGTMYRGGQGMWTWVLHRITGVSVFFFLLVHVLDTALVRVSPEAYDLVIASYKTPIVNLLEIGLVGAVLYHALNGLRVILVDFWAKGPRYQRQMTWAIATVWVLLMVPGTFFMIKHTVEALFGSSS